MFDHTKPFNLLEKLKIRKEEQMLIYLANRVNVSITVRLFISQSNCGQNPISRSRP
jgi:hypothetical protein